MTSAAALSDARPWARLYPTAERHSVMEVRHGRTIADPYRWLEDPRNPRTRQWLDAQQLLADCYSSHPATRKHLTDRLSAFGAAGIVSPPTWRGDRQFIVRRDPEQDMPSVQILSPDGSERTLLDPLELDPSGLTHLDSWKVSRDGRLVAYQVSRRGTEQSVLYVMDTDSREHVDGPIDRLRGSPVVWAPDSSGFWYVRRLPTSRHSRTTVAPRRVFWHRVGSTTAEDVLVFGDGYPDTTGFWPRLYCYRWLTLRTTDGTSSYNTLWVADLARTSTISPEFHVVAGDDHATVTPAVGYDGRMYLHTTLEAPRGRVCVVDLADLDRIGPEHWQELISEESDSTLAGAVPLSGGRSGPERLLVLRIRHATGAASVHDAYTGQLLHDVSLPGAGLLSTPVPHHEGGRSLWLLYSDFVTPTSVMRYDLDGHRLSTHARPPGRIPDLPVRCRQVEYESADGTRVRMFIIGPQADADGPDKPRPALLTGYGGFGVSMLPQYRSDAMAWVEAGGVFAAACIRGGSEEGESWHQAAVRAGKQRAIDDFNAAAEYLITHGWTTEGQLAAYGSSNGGLLVNAAMLQRPDLYRAVATNAALTDMLRYELTGLGPLWRSEYGSAADPHDFQALLSYSPYHHVQPGVSYPAVLLIAPESDTRVDPLHSRKQCAILQHASIGTGPILFRSVRDAGHGSGTRSSAIATMAEALAFLAEQTGLLPKDEERGPCGHALAIVQRDEHAHRVRVSGGR